MTGKGLASLSRAAAGTGCRQSRIVLLFRAPEASAWAKYARRQTPKILRGSNISLQHETRNAPHRS